MVKFFFILYPSPDKRKATYITYIERTICKALRNIAKILYKDIAIAIGLIYR